MQPQGLQPGIYFGLPEEQYQNDPALSRSDMKNILLSPRDYWENSNLNPNRKKKKSKEMQFGDYCHKFLLEPKLFEEKFRVVGRDRWIKGDGKTPINLADFNKVETAINLLRTDEYANALFTGGYAEVSIFWRDEETGIMLKVRIDYLQTFCAPDYKTTRSLATSDIGYALSDYAYDIQEQLYYQGVTVAKASLRSKDKSFKVVGDVDPKWLKKFTEEDMMGFRFIFQRSIVPNIFDEFDIDHEVQENARIDIRNAIDTYAEYITKYGTDTWPATTGIKRTISLYHMKRRAKERGMNRL